MRLIFEVPDDLHARFKAETAAHGVKQAAVVRFLIDVWLKDPDMGPKPAKPAPNTPRSVTNASGPVTNAPEHALTANDILQKIRTKR